MREWHSALGTCSERSDLNGNLVALGNGFHWAQIADFSPASSMMAHDQHWVYIAQVFAIKHVIPTWTHDRGCQWMTHGLVVAIGTFSVDHQGCTGDHQGKLSQFRKNRAAQNVQNPSWDSPWNKSSSELGEIWWKKVLVAKTSPNIMGDGAKIVFHGFNVHFECHFWVWMKNILHELIDGLSCKKTYYLQSFRGANGKSHPQICIVS